MTFSSLYFTKILELKHFFDKITTNFEKTGSICIFFIPLGNLKTKILFQNVFSDFYTFAFQ